MIIKKKDFLFLISFIENRTNFCNSDNCQSCNKIVKLIQEYKKDLFKN
jgi:hypothetical protein